MRKKYVVWLLTLAALAVLFCVGCPIYTLFGVRCPACGVTRAWLSFLRGDISTALNYHLFFFLLPIFVILYILYDNRLCGRYERLTRIFLTSSAAIIFVYHIIRLYVEFN